MNNIYLTMAQAHTQFKESQYIEIGYSDYGGSLVDVSNIKDIEDNFKYGRDYIVWDTIYSGRVLIFIRNGHTIETIDSLCYYPLINDETYSILDNELLQEAKYSFMNDNNLRNIESVNNCLNDVLTNNGNSQATSYDYSHDTIMNEFISTIKNY